MRQEFLSFRVSHPWCRVGEVGAAPALQRSQHRVPLGVLVRSEMLLDPTLVTSALSSPCVCLLAVTRDKNLVSLGTSALQGFINSLCPQLVRAVQVAFSR